MSKETEDALHMLLHCSLKDTEYETQFEQYKIVRNYITNLQQENKQLKEKLEKAIEKVKDISFKFTTDKNWYCVVLSTTTDGKELLEILGDKENEN